MIPEELKDLLLEDTNYIFRFLRNNHFHFAANLCKWFKAEPQGKDEILKYVNNLLFLRIEPVHRIEIIGLIRQSFIIVSVLGLHGTKEIGDAFRISLGHTLDLLSIQTEVKLETYKEIALAKSSSSNSQRPTNGIAAIKIKPKYQRVIIEKLSQYFSETDHESLAKVLSGKRISHPILFKNNANKLVHFMSFILKNNGFINDPPKNILTGWICSSFLYLSTTGKLQNFDSPTVLKLLSTNLDLICKNPIPGIENLFTE